MTNEEIIRMNGEILRDEIYNLIHGEGEGFREGCGALSVPCRYYSKIPGVKNIRLHDKTIIHRETSSYESIWYVTVKTVADEGYLLPEEVTVRGTIYHVEFTPSKHYGEEWYN